MKIHKFNSLTSTNDYMKINFKNFNEFDAVVAKTQTKGKSRRGNEWLSQEGMALFTFFVKKRKYFSDEDTDYLKIPLLAGLSVIKGLIEIKKLEYMFKWTNDIYLSDKKLCGILVEKLEDYFFIGIGINVNNSLPAGISEKAISLKEATGSEENIERIIISIIGQFKILYDRFISGKWNEILAEINKLNYLKGKKITLKINNTIFSGIAQNINEDGEIEILINNKIHSFSIGEVFENKIVFAGKIKNLNQNT